MSPLADDIFETMVAVTREHADKLIAQGRVERLEREKAELVAAIIGLELFFQRPDENKMDSFERVAEVFHKETGYLRPGKDSFLHDPEVRERAYDEWVAKKLAASRAAIAKATQP